MIRALWPALASLGAGLVLFATAAGAAPVIAVPVGLAGAVELVWALAVLRAGRLVAPRAAIAGGAVGIAGSGFLLLTGPLALIPFLALFVFHWSIAIAAVLEVRRLRADSAVAPGETPDARAVASAGGPVSSPIRRRAGGFTIALVIEAMLVAAIATPALAASEAGEFAVPHGTLHSGH
ncbi:hypothetical protein NS354_02190 [Leucobacter chromiiresistens]|uniref:Uncharacterized protein n=2 Tax=Leucobacter chromiiresistens TaxID=1079994 RepID=A0A147EQX3_9MICO|nr:hypothetical protein NS354_02190 [Leucobacter chromiiresistens]